MKEFEAHFTAESGDDYKVKGCSNGQVFYKPADTCGSKWTLIDDFTAEIMWAIKYGIQKTGAPKTKRPVTPPPPPPPRVEAPPVERIIEGEENGVKEEDDLRTPWEEKNKKDGRYLGSLKERPSAVASALSEAAEKMGWLPKNDDRKDLLQLAEHTNNEISALNSMIGDLHKHLYDTVKRVHVLENPEKTPEKISREKALGTWISAAQHFIDINDLREKITDLREINRELSGVKSSFEANKKIMSTVKLVGDFLDQISIKPRSTLFLINEQIEILNQEYGILSE